MPFLFDGYNVYHGAVKLCEEWSRITPITLCKFIAEDMARIPDIATVVFDGRQPRGRKSKVEPLGFVKILYSGQNKEADVMLEKLIAKNTAPRRLIVVSSDRQLRRAARRRRAVSLSSVDYLLELIKRREQPPPIQKEPKEKHRGVPEGQLDKWLELFGIDPDKNNV